MAAKKNILIWAGWYPNSTSPNSGVFIRNHIGLIDKERFNIYPFHIEIDKSLVLRYKKHQITEDFGAIEIYKIPSFFLFKFIYFCAIPLKKIYFSKFKVDGFHLHVSHPFIFFLFPFLLFNKKTPKFLTEHWSGYFYKNSALLKSNAVFRSIFFALLKRFDRIYVVSNLLKKPLIEFGIDTQKIHILPNLVHINSKCVVVKKKDALRFMMLSNLKDSHKNISEVISVFSELSKTHTETTLHIFGDGTDKNFLENIARDFGILDKSVFFHGYLPNELVLETYLNYDCFILNSFFETFSIVTAEALGSGLPVIISACGGPELFVNKENGVVVKSKEELLDAIIWMHSNIECFNPEKIQNEIKSKFGLDSLKSKVNQVYV